MRHFTTNGLHKQFQQKHEKKLSPPWLHYQHDLIVFIFKGNVVGHLQPHLNIVPFLTVIFRSNLGAHLMSDCLTLVFPRNQNLEILQQPQ